jgi:lipid-binding SYLF domain-containing protein
MAAKSTSNRRSSANKNTAKSTPSQSEDEYAIEDSLAYEHGFTDEDDEDSGYVAQATEQVRSMTRGREGKIVVAALASGFAIGAAIGCVIASSHQRKATWSDRLACEGLGRRMLDRIGSALPESITEKLHRS